MEHCRVQMVCLWCLQLYLVIIISCLSVLHLWARLRPCIMVMCTRHVHKASFWSMHVSMLPTETSTAALFPVLSSGCLFLLTSSPLVSADINIRVYEHAPSGAVRNTHPLLKYYLGAIFLDQGGYRQLKATLAQQPPTEQQVCIRWCHTGATYCSGYM